MKSLNEIAKYISLIHPKAITATETGTGVNIEGYNDDALAVLDLGALGGTTETFDAKVEVSSDGTNYTTAATFGQVTGSNGDNKVAAARVNLAGKTHVRGVITMSGSSSSLVQMGILVRPFVEGASVNSATPA